MNHYPLTVEDQWHERITFKAPVRRIVSLVPSLSELLADAGLKSLLVGVTGYCVHPRDLRRDITTIGGTKDPDIEKIIRLKPDLVIANKEENTKSDVDALRAAGINVFVADINTFDDVHEFLLILERIFCSGTFKQLSDDIKQKWQPLKNCLSSCCVVYMIWRKPYMAAGKGTFIDYLLTYLGLENAVKEDRYPAMTAEELAVLSPDVMMLSSEPFPFSAKFINEFKEICPNATPLLIDGEAFSWYGSRLCSSADYIREEMIPYFKQ